MIDWEEFLLYEARSPDYIFETDVKTTFIKSISDSLEMMERLRPVFEKDVLNKKKICNQMTTLATVQKALTDVSADENLFVESW